LAGPRYKLQTSCIYAKHINHLTYEAVYYAKMNDFVQFLL